MDLSKLLDLLGAPARYFVAIAIATSLLLFLPPELLKRAHLDEFVQQYGGWIGAFWLASVTLAVLNGLHRLTTFISGFRTRGAATRRALASLTSLDHEEKSVLREFFLRGRNTLKLPVTDAAVASLLKKGVLTQVGALGEGSAAGPLVSLAIAESVSSVLTREHIGIPEGDLSDAQIEALKRRRPAFTAAVETHEWLASGRGLF